MDLLGEGGQPRIHLFKAINPPYPPFANSYRLSRAQSPLSSYNNNSIATRGVRRRLKRLHGSTHHYKHPIIEIISH